MTRETLQFGAIFTQHPPTWDSRGLGLKTGWRFVFLHCNNIVASRLSGGLYEIYEYIEILYTLKTGWRSIALRKFLGGGL